MAAAKESVVRWTALAAASHRQIADGVEKLGPLGSDVFLERYQQAVAVEMGNAGEQATALFKQIASTPKYAETFRTNEVCADRQALARAK